MSSGTLISFQPQADTLTYEAFYGLKEKAFSLNADPRFLFHSPSHAAAFENLVAGIRRREGLLVLTGEIGAGKTMLCQAVLKNLGRKTFSSFVPDPFASREDLLKMLLLDFGVLTVQELTTGSLQHASRTELSYLLSGFLGSLAPLEAFVVVIIDEAQNMSLSLIEETRILSDSFGGKGGLQIVFVGQPELHTKLKLPEMRQVDQRVCGYNHLAPLTVDGVAGYVQHRLQVAGCSRPDALFAPDVIDILYRRSGGVPRLINRICDRALALAHQRQAARVDREILETALIDVGASTLTPTWASIVCQEPELRAQPAASIAPPVPAAELPAAEAVPPAPAVNDASVPPTVAPPISVDAEPSGPAAVASLWDPLPEEDQDDFPAAVSEWLTQEIEPAFLKLKPIHKAASEKGHTPASPPSVARVVTREVPTPPARRRSRPETLAKKLKHVWTKKLAVAAIGVAAIGSAMVGAALLLSTLPGVMLAQAELPALPAAPAPAVPGMVTAVTPPPVEAPQPVVSGGDYLVAVGLFASPERADRLVLDLVEAGLPADQRPFQLRRQRVQQVVLGPFTNRSDAAAELQRLRKLGGYDDANVVDKLLEPAER